MRLERTLFGTTFQNPVLLAAGTCGFGQELADVVDLERLGGMVTKSVTLEPRSGNPAPRVSELPVGMINSIGLANPGVERVRAEKLPWLAANLGRARVFVSVAGHNEREYAEVVGRLDGEAGFLGFEINLSCPNDTGLAGLPFALDPDATAAVIGRCRARTQRPLLAKLAPNVPEIAPVARAAVNAGADGITVVNTLPALVMDADSGRTALGAGPGGLSGAALQPVGVQCTAQARAAVDVPILGVGGIYNASDAVQYLRAGASLVQVGTASFADPHAGERVVRGLARLGRRAGLVGVDEWTRSETAETGGR